jgi:hypothetical protein
MRPLLTVALYINVKIYVLFMNDENETALFRE